MIIKIEPDEKFMKELKEINENLSEMKRFLINGEKNNSYYECLYCKKRVIGVIADYFKFEIKTYIDEDSIGGILTCNSCYKKMYAKTTEKGMVFLPYDYFSQAKRSDIDSVVLNAVRLLSEDRERGEAK